MSVNSQTDLWQEMLSDFDQRAEFWLKKMHSTDPNRLFDEDFEKMFLKISSDRLAATYSIVKMKLKWEPLDTKPSPIAIPGQRDYMALINETEEHSFEVNFDTYPQPNENATGDEADDDNQPLNVYTKPPKLPRKTGPSQRNKNGKRHQCDQCNFSTDYASNFKRHHLVHTGERPFKCKKCSKCFTRKTHLTSHEKASHH